MSENSATAANCKLLLPLPLPPLRPPLASAGSGNNKRRRMDDHSNIFIIPPREEERGREAVKEEEVEMEERRDEDDDDEKRKDDKKEKEEYDEQKRKKPSSGRGRGHGKQFSAASAKRLCRLRRPAERIRRFLFKWPILGDLLHPAFRRYVKRSLCQLAPSPPHHHSRPGCGHGLHHHQLQSPTSSSTSSPKRPFRHFILPSPHPPSSSSSFSASSSSASSSSSPARRLALRLQRRSIRYPPLPRLPAFQCPKCSLSSRRAQVMANHICAKRPPEYKNVAQVVELGFRSRVKDALAVLERIPNPQSVRISKRCEAGDDEQQLELEQYNQPPTLCEIAMRCVQRMHAASRGRTEVQTWLEGVPCSSLIVAADDQQKISLTNGGDGVALFCASCQRLFADYADWDEHLLDENEEGEESRGTCSFIGQQPVEVEIPPCDALTVVPILPRIDPEIPPQSTPRQWHCTKCADGGGPFASRAQFHAHLMRCALSTNTKVGKEENRRYES